MLAEKDLGGGKKLPIWIPIPQLFKWIMLFLKEDYNYFEQQRDGDDERMEEG